MINTDIHYPAREHGRDRALAECQRARGTKRLAPRHWKFSKQLEELTCVTCRTIRQAAP